MLFIPSNLRIEKGSRVMWKVKADTMQSNGNSSLFYNEARSHIISFDDIFVESPKLELFKVGSDSFNMNF